MHLIPRQRGGPNWVPTTKLAQPTKVPTPTMASLVSISPSPQLSLLIECHCKVKNVNNRVYQVSTKYRINATPFLWLEFGSKNCKFLMCLLVPVGFPKNPSNFSFFLLSNTTPNGAPNKSISTDTGGISPPLGFLSAAFSK